jgi:ectoine hydroxylase-related dioxygenase (phytanoyl-CoA dioxygenase family)
MSWSNPIREDGFAIIPNVFAAAEMDRLSKGIEQSSTTRSRAGVRHALRLTPVAEIAQDQCLLDIAREVLGAGAFPFHATLFEKTSDANWLVVWHQDTALPLCRKISIPGWGPWSLKEGVDYAHAPAEVLSQVLALRIHLDESTSDNGPLRVLPRTHSLGVLSDDQIHEISVRISPTECVAPKGSVLAMWPLLVHASSKSRGFEPRRVLHIEYAASSDIAGPMELAIA